MLLAMPPSKSSSGRNASVVTAARSIVAFGLVVTGLCRCGSAFSTASDSDAGDGSVVPVGSPFGDGSSGAKDAGDGGPSDGAGMGCDPTRDPKDAPCLVDGVFGVFVSATSGTDTGIGTKDDPLRTIGEGIAKAALVSKPRVYVCNGSYAEQVSLDVQHDGIGLYGGFDCARGWTWAGDAGAAQVVSPSALYALRVDATTKPIAIEDMTFMAPDATGYDATGAGNASIAAFVSNESAGVIFRRVVLRGGAGAPGSDGGTPPTNWFSTSAADLQGNSADGVAGGAAKDCHCKTAGDTQGGAGGAAGDPAADGGSGTASPLPGQQVRNGAGGAGYNDTSLGCTVGRPGADGSPQGDGGVGASIGSLSASGWQAGLGTDGQSGNPGQGGGGGGGGQFAGGGGAGCGGCGGAGGRAGHGGGASVALLLFNATVALAQSHLVSAAGGDGGSGSAGETGANGGFGGGNASCGGGAGGSGAGGQGGGGGAGGVSVGILSNAPSHATVDFQTTFMMGAPGRGGAPGVGGAGGSVGTLHALSGSSGTKGADGVAQQTFAR